MLYSKLKTYINVLSMFDDTFTDEMIINCANLAYNKIYDMIIDKSEQYFLSQKEYSIDSNRKISFDLPDDYNVILDLVYVMSLENDNALSEYEKNIPISNRRSAFNRYDYFAIIQHPNIIFYNCGSVTTTVTMNYFKTLDELPQIEEITTSSSIELPVFAENLFVWETLRLLSVSDSEIERVSGIDFKTAESSVLNKLGKEKGKSNIPNRQFGRYF